MTLFEKGSSERGVLSDLAIAYSRAGELTRAAKVMALLRTKARTGSVTDTALILYSEGQLAMARHPTEESVETLRRARAAVEGTETTLALADGLRRLGHNDESIELYESVVAKTAPSGGDQVRWVLAHRDLGRLYEASGQADKARSMYVKMLDLWADADAGLQPLEDVRRAIARLGQ